MPPPVPPRVNDGRMIAGYPRVRHGLERVGRDATVWPRGRRARYAACAAANSARSSAIWIDRADRADQLDAELRQRPVPRQRHRDVQRRLAAHRREQGVGTLALDHLRTHSGVTGSM